jgi:superfamily II DNA or RNA helicase
MTYQLRPYQVALILEVDRAWELGHRSVMLQLPTGGGKTIVFSHLVLAALNRGESALILAHREELILQAAAKIQAITAIEPGIIKAGHKPNYSKPIQIASVQSLTRRLANCPHFDLVVVDEAHHSTAQSYRKILEAFPQSLILGVSATPIRLDGTGFTGLFEELVCGVTVRELIEMGSLSPYRYYAPEQTMSLVGVKKRGGDFTTESIEQANPSDTVAADCLKACRDYLEGKQVVIFAVSVAHSIAIAASFQANNIPSAHLDGTSDHHTRAQTMNAFRNGSIKVLTNCALFDEGLDIPGLDGVVLARPTASLGRYLQMVGRALRPAEGKDHARIIDLAGNWERHGLPDDDRLWSLDGVETIARPPFKKLQRKEDGTIEEVTIDITPSSTQFTELTGISQTQLDEEWRSILEHLVMIQSDRGYQKAWLIYRLRELNPPPPLEVWKVVGRMLGYHHGWAKYQTRVS